MLSNGTAGPFLPRAFLGMLVLFIYEPMMVDPGEVYNPATWQGRGSQARSNPSPVTLGLAPCRANDNSEAGLSEQSWDFKVFALLVGLVCSGEDSHDRDVGFNWLPRHAPVGLGVR